MGFSQRNANEEVVAYENPTFSEVEDGKVEPDQGYLQVEATEATSTGSVEGLGD